jgi:thiamine biosynthesis lipoprotein
MRLDLGGIAKGYAADEALAVLVRRGFPHALVAASGDVVAGEAPPGESGWTVRAASLSAPETGDAVVHLRNQALSTSGDTQQSAEIDGKIYSHILDLKTGLGLTQRRMVNVVAPTSALADGWATALSVAGPTAVNLPSGICFRYEEAAIAPGEASTVVLRHWSGSSR